MSVNGSAAPAQETPKAGEATQQQSSVQEQKSEVQPKENAGTPPADAKPEAGKEAKPEAPAEQKPVVPEKYDLKLPEGSHLSASAIEEIATFAKERGLSNEQAQAVLERENRAVASFKEGQVAELEERKKAWVEQASADKEIGGTAFKENVELARRALTKFCSKEFLDTLDSTGLGNHPELVRTFTRIGKAMGNDRMVMPGAQAGGSRPIEEVFYPKMRKEQ